MLAIMEDAGFIIGSYVVTFAAIGGYAAVRAAPGPRARRRAPARRGQALDLRQAAPDA